MSDDEYRCDACGETFTKGRSEEQQLADMKTNFGDLPEEDRAVVCDDCFREIMPPGSAGYPTEETPCPTTH